LNASKSFIPKDKRQTPTNPYFNKSHMSTPIALKTCKSAQSRDDLSENHTKDRGSRQKSDSMTNPNRSFTSLLSNSQNPLPPIDTTLYMTRKQQVIIPVHQPFVKIDKKCTAKLESQLIEVQKLLRAEAEDGNLMIENEELLKHTDNPQLVKK